MHKVRSFIEQTKGRKCGTHSNISHWQWTRNARCCVGEHSMRFTRQLNIGFDWIAWQWIIQSPATLFVAPASLFWGYLHGSGRTLALLTHSPSVHFLRSWSDCPIQIYSYNNADLWIQNRKSKSIYGNHCVRMSNKMLIRFEECSPDKWFIYLQLWALEWICTRVSVEQRLMWRSVLKWRNCWSTMDNSYTQLMQNVTAMSDHCAIIRLDSVWLWHSLMNGRCLANDRLSMHT